MRCSMLLSFMMTFLGFFSLEAYSSLSCSVAALFSISSEFSAYSSSSKRGGDGCFTCLQFLSVMMALISPMCSYFPSLVATLFMPLGFC